MVGKVYQTAPAKMYQHPNFTIFEGVYNRSIKEILITMIDKEGFEYVDISSGNLCIGS